MISLIKKYRYIFIVLCYGILLIWGSSSEEGEGEAEATLLAMLLTVVLAIYWIIVQIKSVIRLKNENKKAELSHLQSQVSPHFFFNTLNNLYGLVSKDTKKAQQLILKLSDMMRYSIYDGQKELVTIEEEVLYLNNYIELHTARYHKKTEIIFNKHIQKEGLTVKPLLFIILVENSFKHGLENLREDAYVQISLIANDHEISFAVENNFEEKEESKVEGIGLMNLERRLELLYPNKHTLSHSISNNIYKAQLTLKLK